MIPRRMLPPNALVIALSPLLDQRSVGALLDLRARGYDLAVIDVSPVPFTPRPERRPRRASRTTSGCCAATRSAIACSARASPSPSGATTRRCKPHSRRCGHSGVTPGSRAPDHRRRLALAALGGADAYAATAGGRFGAVARRGGVRGWSCSLRRARAALARRSIPWAVCAAGGGYWPDARATTPSTAWAAVVGVLLLLGAELASGRSSTTRAFTRSARVVVRRAATLLPRRRPRSWSNFVLLGAAALSASASVVLAAAGVAAAVAAVAVVVRAGARLSRDRPPAMPGGRCIATRRSASPCGSDVAVRVVHASAMTRVRADPSWARSPSEAEGDRLVGCERRRAAARRRPASLPS